MAEILIIDDDESTLLFLKEALKPDHTTTGCASLEEARKVLDKKSFGLILLGVLLPDGNGFEFFDELKRAKNVSSVPVLFLSGQSSIADETLGLSLGAEDYIVKPVHFLRLKARVDSKLSKYEKAKKGGETLELGPLKFDLPKQRSYLCDESGEHELDLTTLEFKLLLHFSRREDQVFSRDQLITAIWGEDVHILDRTIDTHVSHLRNKIKGAPFSLEAVQGVGYRFTRMKPELKQHG